MAETTRDEPHLLLLAGSGEARAVAAALAREGAIRVTASLARPPRAFGPLAAPTRIGGFGGENAFERFLEAERITAVLDATHPFAVRIGERTARVCRRKGLPYARVLRPAWRPAPEDRWSEVPDEAAAAARLKPGQRAFVTTGRATLERLVADSEAEFLVRRLDPGFPPAAGTCARVSYVEGAGPFTVDQETATLRGLGVDILVVKNSGGAGAFPKLEAARRLGLPVILIARPPQPPGPRLESVAAALGWVAAL